ncbi:MAG: glycosyltransferase family 2 protein [Lachnospiraceae bacterium]|nr:glycosyltransferase family 2 protein [Lachnospiraceae bacterium]
MKINLVMIVKNEARSLKRCLTAARPLVDEMIVADTGSTDGTKQIALKAGAKVYDFSWVRDFSAARNFALEQSDGDWNLVLDADEYLRPVSRRKLESALKKGNEQYGAGKWMGAILRFDSFMDTAVMGGGKTAQGEKTVSVSSALLPRLLPRGVRYKGMIHEQPDTEIPCILLPLQADHDGYLVEGKSERNLEYLEEAVRREADHPYYWYQMAVTLRGLSRLEESLIWFRRLYEGGARESRYWADGVLRYLYTLMDLDAAPFLEEALTVVDDMRPVLGGRADFCFVCGLYYMKLVLSDVQRYIGYLPRIEESYLECLRIGEHPEQETVAGTGSFKAAYNLGLWYEVSGQTQKARTYYGQAAREGYGPARDRLKGLGKS